MTMLSIGIGLVASFAFTEITGLSAGGLVVPGYVALYLDQPGRVAATLVLALATYLVVRLLSNWIIIYGRRRFMAMILVGFWLEWAVARLAWEIPPLSLGQEFRAIGYVIPGLIANEAARQGIPRTFAATLLVSVVVRMVLFLAR